MKKQNITQLLAFSLVILSLIIASCQQLNENPLASINSVTYYNTENDLITACAGNFYPLVKGWSGLDQTNGYCVAYGGDDVTSLSKLGTGSTGNKDKYSQFDVMNAPATNSAISSAWNPLWGAIRQSNDIIANYNNVTGLSQADKDKYAAIAYFVRGFSYFYLARTWGDVPIITKNLSPGTPAPRDPVAKVYDQIVSDLLWAEKNLPLKSVWGSKYYGFPSKGACQSILAKVYLTMAGYPLKKGASYYALAANIASKVIQSNQYDLWANYGDAFKIANNNGKESVFALQFSIASGMGNNMYGISAMPGEENGWDDYMSELAFYKNYPESPRKRDCFYDTIWVTRNNIRVRVPYDQTLTPRPYFKKFREGGFVNPQQPWVGTTTGGNHVQDLVRYSDVLLVFAEGRAKGLGTPNDSASWAVNKVRTRAGLPNLVGLSADNFNKAVVDERAWELAGEFHRWYDMTRLEMVEQVVAARDPKEDPIQSKNIRNSYLAPIPSYDMLLNPQWTQNPGY